MQILFILVKIKLDIFFIRKPGSKHKHRRHHRVVDVQTGLNINIIVLYTHRIKINAIKC